MNYVIRCGLQYIRFNTLLPRRCSLAQATRFPTAKDAQQAAARLGCHCTVIFESTL